MDTTEDIRWLFIAIVMRAKQLESEGDCKSDIMLRDTLLRIKARESDGLYFVLEDYVERVLYEADTHRESHQELARVLQGYVQFEYTLQLFGRLPRLRQLFKKARLNRWLQMKSHVEEVRHHVSRYFELLDQATRAGENLSAEDIERCEHLALIFRVPLTLKLIQYKEFLAESESQLSVSEYKK